VTSKSSGPTDSPGISFVSLKIGAAGTVIETLVTPASLPWFMLAITLVYASNCKWHCLKLLFFIMGTSL